MEVEKRQYNTEERRAMAEKGEALPDGSFPIADKADLGNALQSIGRAGNRALALRHIRARARALDAMDMLPDWAMEKALVPLADGFVLKALRPFADLSDIDWEILVEEVATAGGIANVEGFAKTVLEKAKSFGGDRSAAGRYAAQVRWGKRPTSSDEGDEGESGARAAAAPPPPPPNGPSPARRAANARWAKRTGGTGQPPSADGGSTTGSAGGNPPKPSKPWDSPEEQSRASDLAGRAKSMTVSDISSEIRGAHRRTGQKVSPAAKPYLDAMDSMRSARDNYGADSGTMILAYAISNLRSFKGAVAKILKGEMNRRLKGGAEDL